MNSPRTLKSWLFSVTLLCAGWGIAVASDRITAPDGPADSPIESPRSLVEVTAGQADSKATVSGGFFRTIAGEPTNGCPPEGQPDPNKNMHALVQSWSFSASAPIGDGPDPTQIATFDGLADAANVGMKLQRVYGSYHAPCLNELTGYFEKIGKGIDKKNEELAKATGEEQKAIERSLTKQGCSIDAHKIKADHSTDTARCVLTREEYLGYLGLFIPPKNWLFIPGFGAKIGSKTFKVLNTETLKDDEARRTPWSLQAYAGFHFSDSLLTVGYRYDSAYKDAPQVALCPPPGTDPLTSCTIGRVNEPIRNETSVPYIEFRRAIIKKDSIAYAYAPIVSYEMKKSILGIQFPVYFVRDDKGSLTGGLSFGWRSDQPGVNVSVIVSTAFSAYPTK